MLFNIHGEQTRASVNVSTAGNNTVIASIPNGEIFIHELIGEPTAAVTLNIYCGSRLVGTFPLVANQGLTENDVVGNSGEPRFKCFQNEAFILNLSSAVPFQGSILYSYKT